MQIRNVAIIAHVDHGKTTLVDSLLKQTKTFRENQKEFTQDLIMDSNDLEREKGITILAKNTSVFYKDTKINIIDTPGHADFGGEVERTLNMASAAILLVDAAEGPLPQTKFVLKKALEHHLKVILIINKIDKRDSRPAEVISQVEDLFLELAQDESSLEFVTLYAVGRDGKAFFDLPETYSSDMPGDLSPLFEAIIENVPNVNTTNEEPLQLLISTLDYDTYVGRLSIGKVTRGTISKNQTIALVEDDKVKGTYKVQKLYTTEGLNRVEVEKVESGDIATLAGIAELTIGQTVCDPANPVSLPKIEVEDPTLKMTIGPNTSPFSGREGKFGTSRQLKERLHREVETNLGLKVEDDVDGARYTISGRGELHLSILLEEMRREGYEMEVSKPQVILKTIDGVVCEPYEEVTVEVEDAFMGLVSEEMGKRKGEMRDMKKEGNRVYLTFRIATQNLLGIRNSLLTKTRGTMQLHSYFLGYEPKGSRMESLRNGALVAVKPGVAMNYGIGKVQDRGVLFVGTGTEVYEGMVVGLANRPMDIEVNICREKQLSNNRSVGEGVSVHVAPPSNPSLEQFFDMIGDDEYLEITPTSLRLRKKWLSFVIRRVKEREGKSTVV